MAQVDMKSDAPVGAIVAYLGGDVSELVAKGWLPCDGRALEGADFPDLFAAIGTAFGKTSDGDFCLPDLRGVFLRGVDDGAGRDPDAASRTASGPDASGHAGDAIGSLQKDATRSPDEARFKVSDRFSFGSNSAHGGCDDGKRIRFRSGTGTIPVTGGDAESRPVNIAVNYLIKALPNVETDLTVGQVPVGAVLSLPFVPRADQSTVDDFWRACDGATYIAAPLSTFHGLFLAIGTNSGGVADADGGVQRFAAPDLQGMYLRGVLGDRPDPALAPDSRRRLSPRPDLDIPGNAGDAVGSYERWATGRPRSSSFSVAMGSYPFDRTGGYQAGSATAARHQGSVTTFTVSGGGAETRPKTMSVGWHIRFRPSGEGTPGAELPVGAILAVATDDDLTHWATCRGQSLPIRGFEELFAVLGTRFGGDGDVDFALPDLRGRFLRGVGALDGQGDPRARGEPPADGGMFQKDLAAAPSAGNPFQIGVAGYPGTSKDNVINYGTGTKLLKITGDKTIFLTGGDAETRPININIRFIIKTRS